MNPKGIGPERKVRNREVPPQFTKLMKVACVYTLLYYTLYYYQAHESCLAAHAIYFSFVYTLLYYTLYYYQANGSYLAAPCSWFVAT